MLPIRERHLWLNVTRFILITIIGKFYLHLITLLCNSATLLWTILLMQPIRAINQITRKSTEPLMYENTGDLIGYRCHYINTLAGGHACKSLLTVDEASFDARRADSKIWFTQLTVIWQFGCYQYFSSIVDSDCMWSRLRFIELTWLYRHSLFMGFYFF